MGMENVKELKSESAMLDDKMYALLEKCRRLAMVGDVIVMGGMYYEKFFNDHAVDLGNMVKEAAENLDSEIEDLFGGRGGFVVELNRPNRNEV